MSDNELIELVAQTWVANGGDAEGIAFCWKKIKDCIEELRASSEGR